MDDKTMGIQDSSSPIQAKGRLVLFGAGMTGRGQVAQLAYEDGWSLTLIDVNEELVHLLEKAGAYTVFLVGETPRQVVISGYQALHTSETTAIERAIQEADLVVTSVLEPNLPAVAEILAPALVKRLENGGGPLNVMAAENMLESSALLQGHVRRLLPGEIQEKFFAQFGFPNSMIARVVPVSKDPLYIYTETYSEWTADRLAAVGDPPTLNGLEWVTNQPARMIRKLYTANTAHAVTAYLGWLAGYEFVHQAAQDAEIAGRFQAAIAETRAALCLEYGFSREDLAHYGASLGPRLANPALPDTLKRVIRQPIRKLGKDERLVGPLLLCEKHALPHPGLSYAIGAVLAAVVHPTRPLPEDEQFMRLRQAIHRLGPVSALEELTGYRPDPRTQEQILAAFRALAKVKTTRDIQSFLNEISQWASAQPDVAALALVGSYARDAAREDSDIDLVFLTSAPQSYLTDIRWTGEFGAVLRTQTENYGRF